MIAADIRAAHSEIFHQPWYRKHFSLLVLGGVGVYLLVSFFLMGFHNIPRDWRGESFGNALLDFYSYTEELKVNYRRLDSTNLHRGWTSRDGDTFSATIHNRYTVDIEAGEVRFRDGDALILEVLRTNDGAMTLGVLPKVDTRYTAAEISQENQRRAVRGDGPVSESELAIAAVERGRVAGERYTFKPKFKGNGDVLNVTLRFDNGSLVKVTNGAATVVNRRLGWEYFWFGEDHELTRMTGSEFWSYLTSGEVRDVERTRKDARGVPVRYTQEFGPVRYTWHSFLNNDDWKHQEVYIAALESLIMAYCGLVLAAFLAVLIAFPAARNVSNATTSFFLKRFMDIVRAIDHLFWALIFIRGGFGPGMLSGIASFTVVETGTLGKLMAEAIENIDNKQPEGVRSTGASELAVKRFGFLPQILPVFVSQVLYFFESNVRSATVIGAVCGAGLGLRILGNARNGTDWEDIAYTALIIIVMVFIIDGFTSWLRGRLIGLGQGR